MRTNTNENGHSILKALFSHLAATFSNWIIKKFRATWSEMLNLIEVWHQTTINCMAGFRISANFPAENREWFSRFYYFEFKKSSKISEHREPLRVIERCGERERDEKVCYSLVDDEIKYVGWMDYLCACPRTNLFLFKLNKCWLGGGLYNANRFLIPFSRRSICVQIFWCLLHIPWQAMSQKRKRKFVFPSEICQIYSRHFSLIDIYQPLHIPITF